MSEINIIPLDTIKKAEEILETVVERHITTLQNEVTEVLESTSQLKELQSTLEIFQTYPQPSYEVLVSLGMDTFSQAIIENPQQIFMSIGHQFYLEMSLSEALAFIPIKENFLKKQVEYLLIKLAEAQSQKTQLMQLICDASLYSGQTTSSVS